MSLQSVLGNIRSSTFPCKQYASVLQNNKIAPHVLLVVIMRSPNLPSFFQSLEKIPAPLKLDCVLFQWVLTTPTTFSNLPRLREEAQDIVLQYLDYTMIRSIFRKYLLLLIHCTRSFLSLCQSFESTLLSRRFYGKRNAVSFKIFK